MANTLTAAVRTLKRVDPGLSDRDLLARHAGGDPDAFAALVRRHGKTVLAACRQVLADPADVDDAFQATFQVLLKKAKAVAWQPTLDSWLYAVAHRIAVHARGKRARRTNREAEASRRKAAASPDLSWQDAVAVLHEELDRLPERYRRVLLLCYLDGQSRDEAAANLGIRPGAVKGCLERGRALLAARLRKRGVALSAGLLAVLTGNPRAAAGGPSAALIDLTVRAADGTTSSAVTAPVNGATPMALGTKKVLASVLVIAGLMAAGVGLGFGHPAATADDKPVQEMKKQKADAKGEQMKPEVKERTITGTVVGPDGKPVQAELQLVWQEGKPQPLGKTKDDGTFLVTVPLKRGEFGGFLVAKAAGHGPDFVDHGQDHLPQSLTATAEVTFKLPKERPIKGRVLDQQGKPVAGARVVATGVEAFDSDASMEKHLKTWAMEDNNRGVPPGGDRGMGPSKKADHPPAATTAADGRFELAGFGAGHLVTLKLTGRGVADKEVVTLNRDGFDPAPVNKSAKDHEVKSFSSGGKWMLYGPDPSVVLEPEKVIRGTVTDADAKPRAGVSVVFSRSSKNDLNPDFNQATTAQDGRYEIRGARKHTGYMVDPDPAAGLLPCQAFADDTAGYEPIVIDVRQAKGVVVSGRVTNKATGEPVACFMYAKVMASNPFVEKYPPFMHPATITNERMSADKDGRYRVVVIPGRVVLSARPKSGSLKQYKPVAPDPKHADSFHPLEGALTYDSFGGGRGFVHGNWCKMLEAKPGDTELSVDIELEPATTTAVKVIDSAGKPVTGVKATGVEVREFARPTEFPDTDTLTVFNLEAKKERVVAVVHKPRKLVGSLTLTADTKEPVVKLGTGGSVTGRAVAKDGKPLAGVTVHLLYTRRATEEANNVLTAAEPPVTDKNGEFRLDTLFPGQEFRVTFARGKERFGQDKDWAKELKHTVEKHGETLKLGDLKLETKKEE